MYVIVKDVYELWSLHLMMWLFEVGLIGELQIQKKIICLKSRSTPFMEPISTKQYGNSLLLKETMWTCDS